MRVIIINTATVVIVLCWTVLFLISEETARALVNEDGIIQWLQFFVLVVTAVYLFLIVSAYRCDYFQPLVFSSFLTLFLLTVLLAGEEISWGQRIFNIPLPEYFQKFNAQKELSLHNIESFQRFRHWLLIFFGGAGLLVTYLKIHIGPAPIQDLLSVLKPGKELTAFFFFVLLFSLALETGYLLLDFTNWAKALRLRSICGRFSEFGELLVAISAFLYTMLKFQAMKRRKWIKN